MMKMEIGRRHMNREPKRVAELELFQFKDAPHYIEFVVGEDRNKTRVYLTNSELLELSRKVGRKAASIRATRKRRAAKK